MICSSHDKEVVAVSLGSLNDSGSRLLCVECLLEDHHFHKIKYEEFRSRLTGVLQEVEFETLQEAFDISD